MIKITQDRMSCSIECILYDFTLVFHFMPYFPRY